jgi:hypothetical protein
MRDIKAKDYKQASIVGRAMNAEILGVIGLIVRGTSTFTIFLGAYRPKLVSAR